MFKLFLKKFFNPFKEKKFSAGFTFLEAIIALTLVSVGLLGVIGLINFSISQTGLIKGELVAAHLAQEGIEVVRGIRDRNWLKLDDNWLNGLNNGTFIPIFSVDPSSDWSLATSAVGDDNRYVYISNNGFYSQGSGIATTTFNRWVDLEIIDPDNILEVTSTVTWQEKGRTHETQIKDKLYNWQAAANICPPTFTIWNASAGGISYYIGGGAEGGDSCTGWELKVVGTDIPFRADNTRVCIETDLNSSLQKFYSSREGEAICEVLDNEDCNDNGLDHSGDGGCKADVVRVTNPY